MPSHKNKTPISEIVDYWADRIDECDLSVDWSEAEEYCWNCGSPKELTRCHIVPHALGGEDQPGNFVVLCRLCHEEAPNVGDPRIMWDWLIAHKSSFYQTYWMIEGYREYEFIYKRTVGEDIKFLSDSISDHDLLLEIGTQVEKSVRESTRHFGQSTPNKATAAGMVRMTLSGIAEKHGLALPDNRAQRLTPKEYLT